jgi:hypothetical protein
VSGGVPVGEQAGDGPVAEQVVVTVELEPVVAEVDVVGVVGADRHQALVAQLGPLPGLDHQPGVG